MTRNKDQLLGHGADNDGIDEYDNALPDWWLGLFVGTVVWGVAYAVNYHLVSGDSQVLRYEAELVAAATRWPQSSHAPIVLDAPTVSAGAAVFAQQCVACHAADLTGGIGANLVDTTWIHGSDPESIRATITNGVPAKGMPAWGPILGPKKVAQVTAFVVEASRKPDGTP
jgi:cytochrome c oxidase cbb3-type subunit 3